MTHATINLDKGGVRFFAKASAAQSHADKTDSFLVSKADDLNELSLKQLAVVFNHLADELNAIGDCIEHTSRFSTKEVGIKRVRAHLNELWNKTNESPKEIPAVNGSKPANSVKAASKEPDPAPVKGAAPKARKGSGVSLPPKAKILACREGTKQAIMVDMISRPQGATMDELLGAFSGGRKPWKESTVKSCFYWSINTLKGYGVRTSKRGDEDCYHLVYPEGMTEPVPHTPKKNG